MSKHRVFSGPYFLVFGLNKERYYVSLPIQSECGKIRTRKNSIFGYFSRSVGGLKAYNLIKKRIHGKSNLPGYHVNRTVPFQVCDVDYLGPVFAKDIYHSSNDEMHKAYIVLFSCSTSRAVILDLVEENTSKSFISGIKRFIARRGCPKNTVSDNGIVFTSLKNQSFCAEQRIMCKFNLDGAPWWGGFWERLVGMVKSCLKKSIGREKLSSIELLPVLFEVKNVLNKR